MDLAEDPEIHMDADMRIRPDIWILQRILRYKWMLSHVSRDMDL